LEYKFNYAAVTQRTLKSFYKNLLKILDFVKVKEEAMEVNEEAVLKLTLCWAFCP